MVVYGKPNCTPCKSTIKRLDRVGAEYEYVDITTNPEAYALIKDLGYLQAPVVYVDDNIHWSGYDPVKIAEFA